MSDAENNGRKERVVRYVDGDMDGAERVVFEAELAADPSLQDDVKVARTTLLGLETLAEQHLREQLRAVDAGLDAASAHQAQGPESPSQRFGDQGAETLRERKSQGPESPSLRFGDQGMENLRERKLAETLREGKEEKAGGALRWWWAAAAGLVLVVGAGLWLFRPSDPQALAAEFALEEPGLPVLMSTSPQRMDGIMNAYKQGDLATAANLIALSLTLDPTNDTLHYFAGVIAEREVDCAAAAQHYTEVKDVSSFALRTRYRQAMCALRSGQVNEAEVLLKQLVEGPDTQLADRAREILRRL